MSNRYPHTFHQQPMLWSQEYQQFYYLDSQNNQYVLQNGSTIPLQHIPRTINSGQYQVPGALHGAAIPTNTLYSTHLSHTASQTVQPQYESYTAASHIRPESSHSSSGQNVSDALSAHMQNLQLQGTTGCRVITQRRQGPSGCVVDALDTVTDVRTISQSEPKDRITDSSVMNDGGIARRKLEPTPNDKEKLDSRYQVRKAASKFFCLGRVFMILWAEPAVGTNQSVVSGSTMLSDVAYSVGALGQHVYSKVRRFVVVREGPQYCTALPVMTYGGQGVGKDKVKKSDHAIIYSGKTPPTPMESERPHRGEAGMRPFSIRVDLDNPEEKLDPRSRIDFGKLHTIHHNLKVRPFGMVNDKSMGYLVNQFQAVIMDISSSRKTNQSALEASQAQRRQPAAPAGTIARDYVQRPESSQSAWLKASSTQPRTNEEASSEGDDSEPDGSESDGVESD